MNTISKGNTLRVVVCALSLFTSAACDAGHGRAEHGHGGYYNDGGRREHYHGGGGGYGWGGFFFGGGDYYNRGGWEGPNIIINVPGPRQYVPVCQTFEVCDAYGECWLEDRCE